MIEEQTRVRNQLARRWKHSSPTELLLLLLVVVVNDWNGGRLRERMMKDGS
jgi:hypothetical protein